MKIQVFFPAQGVVVSQFRVVMVQHRCSSFEDNASSHCRLPTMFLTAQAQLSRSKNNSGRGRKLENVQNTREILQPPPLRVSQRRLCRKTRAIRGSHNRCWTPNNSGLLPSWSSDSCELPSTRSPLPPFLKSVFRTPSCLARLLLPPSPAAGRTRALKSHQPSNHPTHDTQEKKLPQAETPHGTSSQSGARPKCRRISQQPSSAQNRRSIC